eukprot:9311527-Ditylum_brightwellii.AAC.1
MPLNAVIGLPMHDFDSKPVAAVSITAKKQSDQKTKTILLVITQQSDLTQAGIGKRAKGKSLMCQLDMKQIAQNEGINVLT